MKKVVKKICFLSLAAMLSGCKLFVTADELENVFSSVNGSSSNDGSYTKIALKSSITYVQPMTGLVVNPWQASQKNSTHNESIALEFLYCLQSKVVTGKSNGKIIYDWSSLDNELAGIAARNHQAVIRFRYENPGNKEVDTNNPGATSVPQYIKNMPDYNETKVVSQNVTTYYADWSNEELKSFTKQFYKDFNEKYKNDNRVAFIQVGFGHWSEYHIYGTQLQFGKNFPDKNFQKSFFLDFSKNMTIPWSVGISFADAGYSPFVDANLVTDPELKNLVFGNFDDTFMDPSHEIASGSGWNETLWKRLDLDNRFKTGVNCGEVSYGENGNCQKNFLAPEGVYGYTFKEMAQKYHITYMLASTMLSEGNYNSADQFRQGAWLTGYRFKVLEAKTNASSTVIKVKNEGAAPLYRDAFFAVNGVRCADSLKGLLPGQTKEFVIPVRYSQQSKLAVESDFTYTARPIQFEADL